MTTSMATGFENCKSSQKYCDFETEKENESFCRQRCRFCGRFVDYNIIDGRIDNAKYLRDHVRDFCQRTGPTQQVFFELYGVPEKQKAQQSKTEALEQGFQETKDALKTWKHLESKGFTTREIVRDLSKSV